MQFSSTQQLRIFLSSTFTDMQEERDGLVKLFRELSGEGRKRGVDINLVDLRWGVTDDQRRTGRVISTCLQEIDNSRPFFIGMVGDRYGWIPSRRELTINPELLDKFPQVDGYAKKGLSITEIEMRYGVLDSNTKDDSLFLIKKGINYENDHHRRLSDELTSGKVNYRFYESASDLVSQTKAVMLDLLDRNFPLLKNIPEWEQYENNNELIAKAHRSGYIEYGDYMERLNRWLYSDSQHLVVTSETGGGKSALISAWLGHSDFAGYKVMYHFIGSELAEGSQLEVQRHFLTRLENEYGLTSTPVIQTNGGDEDYLFELEKALKEADKRGDKWLMVIEGLDHLEEVALTKLMAWFPELPPSAKVLFSTVSGDMTYNRLCNALGYEEMVIEPLTKEFVKEIVNHYLANVGKRLDSNLTDMIASTELFSNPNLLRFLLDELVTYGVHEQLSVNVFNFTTSVDKLDFYGKLIARAEEYYGADKIKNLLTLIGGTKSGLSETAILEILNWDSLEWAMIHAGIRRMLSFINGKYTIAHKDIHDALDMYYKYQEDDFAYLRTMRNKVANYIERKGVDVEELAFLKYMTEDYEGLYQLLINPANLPGFMNHGDKLFAMYWTAIMEETDHTLYDYLEIDFVDLPEWDVEDQLYMLSEILTLHFQAGELAIKFKEKIIQTYLAKGEEDIFAQGMVADNYIGIAQDLLDMGKLEEGERMLQASEKIHRSIGEKDESLLLLTKANFATAIGDYENALDLTLRAIDMERRLRGNVPWKYFNNAGNGYYKLCQYEKAIEMYEMAMEEIKKDLIEDTLEGAIVRQNIGLVFYAMEEFDKAEEYYNKALEFYKINLENPGSEVALLLNNLGLVYLSRDQFEEGLDYFMNAAEIIKTVAEASPQHGLIYQNIGFLWEKRGELEKAIEWREMSVRTYWDIVDLDHPEFAHCCICLLNLYVETERFGEEYELAEGIIKRAEEEDGKVCTVVAYSLFKLGELSCASDDNEEARNCYQAALDIFRLLGDEEGVELVEEALSNLED